jgi:SSS family solute:Na+ symporter
MPLYMLMYPFLILTAYYAVSAAPHLKQPNTTLFAVAVDLLPSWLLGLVAGAAALSGLLILAALSLQLGATLSRNITPNLPEIAQRRLTQITLVVYLAVTATLTILAPTLMLNLISVAYFFITQTLVALFGVLFVRWFSALGLTIGLVAGNVAIILLYLLHVNAAGINLGLIALGVNLLVTSAVSAAAKNRTSHPPVAMSTKEKIRPSESIEKRA